MEKDIKEDADKKAKNIITRNSMQYDAPFFISASCLPASNE